MTEPILSPAEEADAEALLAGLAEPVDQYAGLTPLEAAAAATSAHMSTCLRPSRLECVDCSEELHVIRRYLVAVRPGLEAEGMRWAADRIDPGPRDPARDTDPDLVEVADRGTATMLRHWAYMRDPSASEVNPQEPCGICSGYGCPDCRDFREPTLDAPAPRHAVPDDGSYPDGAPVAADLGQERSEEQQLPPEMVCPSPNCHEECDGTCMARVRRDQGFV